MVAIQGKTRRLKHTNWPDGQITQEQRSSWTKPAGRRRFRACNADKYKQHADRTDAKLGSTEAEGRHNYKRSLCYPAGETRHGAVDGADGLTWVVKRKWRGSKGGRQLQPDPIWWPGPDSDPRLMGVGGGLAELRGTMTWRHHNTLSGQTERRSQYLFRWMTSLIDFSAFISSRALIWWSFLTTMDRYLYFGAHSKYSGRLFEEEKQIKLNIEEICESIVEQLSCSNSIFKTYLWKNL